MAYTRDEENSIYDHHNPGSRLSPHIMQRMYGRCGCKFCTDYRRKYIDAGMVSPVNERDAGMSSINMCDRCGAMVRGLALGGIQIRTSSDPDTTEVVSKELCPGCVEELLTLAEMPVQREQKAFTDPYKRTPDVDSVDSATAEQLAAKLFEKLMKAQKTDGPKQISHE